MIWFLNTTANSSSLEELLVAVVVSLNTKRPLACQETKQKSEQVYESVRCAPHTVSLHLCVTI